MNNFIEGLPKAELHLHIEGTFEPELMFEIAKRNNIKIKYNSVDEVKQAYNFSSLQDFLNIYYAGAGVLITEQDFYDLTYAYLKKAAEQNIVYAEIFFDPQTHTNRGIKFNTVINGIYNAILDAENEFGISAKLIMCFLRDLDESSAMKTLEEALPHKDKIIGVGLDSAELGNPPGKFERVFAKAREEGFITVAHAGEEGPAEYVKEAIAMLNISRIDHGNNSIDDVDLLKRIAEMQIALTLCPLSNLKLKMIGDLKDHPLKYMMEQGLLVTINSDDPAYFGGYLNENYIALADALNLTKDEIVQTARNSFTGSFLSQPEKVQMISKIDDYIANSK